MIYTTRVTLMRHCGSTIMFVMSQRWLLAALLLIFGYIRESKELIIKNVNIPATVKAGDTDYVILDCDYDLQNTSDDGLVVKWFFNGNEVTYQWIYGLPPKAGETASKYVDLKYKASDDPFTEYRAIKLDKPGIELTGEYTCVISTFADEKIANSTMIVYSTEENFDLTYKRRIIGNKIGVEVTCMAKGLYPQPTLDISVENVSEKQVAKPTLTLRDDGLYNILSTVTLLDEDLPETTILKCLLSIPRANYNISKNTIYNAGMAVTTTSSTTKWQTDIRGLDNLKSGSSSGDFVSRASINLLLLSIHCVVLLVFY